MTGSDTITTQGSSIFSVHGGNGGGSGVGGNGGSITIQGSRNVTLAGDMDAEGDGGGAKGGTIVLKAGTVPNATLNIQSAAVIQADAINTNGTGTDGTITLSDSCKVQLSGMVDTRNTNLSKGTNSVTYRDTFITDLGSSLLADDVLGGNNVTCRCTGGCSSCVNPPTQGGTVNPPWNVTKSALPACGS